MSSKLQLLYILKYWMHKDIFVEPLGAGQDVGRSCVIVRILNKTIMFDVGIHMLYNDSKRYPDFDYFRNGKPINQVLDLVLITHFHLDHCGALPFLTGFHNYTGPIYASTPTKAMLPYMLEDYRRVASDTKNQITQTFIYNSQQIKQSVNQVNSLTLFQTIQVNDIKITSYYAGHVLGACMFHVEYGGLSVVYTGDYNSNADRHLGAADIPRLKPNIVITQTTYATTIRDTKRDRERNMLKYIGQTLQGGGKVLIPVFALGRAQQLCVLLQTYWNRTQSTYPIYFSAGLIEKANFYYKLFVGWQNQKIKQSYLESNVFDFKKIKPFDKKLINATTPMVLFATPGMLHGGSSMQVFKEWCQNQKNTLIIPGYCVAGTLGNKLLSGQRQLTIDKKFYDVKMRIENISFSAHADAKGILNLLRHLQPQNIVFVHGQKVKMKQFSQIVEQQLGKKVYMPANFQNCRISASLPSLKVKCQVEQGIGYVCKSGKQSKFVLQQNILNQINQAIQLLSEGDSIFCCSQIQSILSTELHPLLIHNSQGKIVQNLQKFILSILQKKNLNQKQMEEYEASYTIQLIDNCIYISGEYERCAEVLNWIQRLNTQSITPS